MLLKERLAWKCPSTRVCHVEDRDNCRAATYEMVDKIQIATYRKTTISALADGHKVYLVPVEGETPAFAIGETYVIISFPVSVKYGKECIFSGAASKKFTPGHLAIIEEMIKLAEETLNPPSVGMTGDEDDLFIQRGKVHSPGDYLPESEPEDYNLTEDNKELEEEEYQESDEEDYADQIYYPKNEYFSTSSWAMKSFSCQES
ncbi:hypothetical protein DPX16_6254 [Anabarilius grahami]|uniref:Uncharacterized protein n=1 Tax=Anabarilius grahami TaxID=495550 RepID=A0A3N0YK00_ANAGA|nr:hypothetical protein DPX16_6254 [Anabarilius grahami]